MNYFVLLYCWDQRATGLFEENAHNPPTFAGWSPGDCVASPDSKCHPLTWLSCHMPTDKFSLKPIPQVHLPIFLAFCLPREAYMLLRAALCNSILKLHSISRPTNEGRQPRVIYRSLQLGVAWRHNIPHFSGNVLYGILHYLLPFIANILCNWQCANSNHRLPCFLYW